MYMVLSMLLGIILSSFFCWEISKTEKSSKSIAKCNVINIASICAGEIIAFLYIRGNSGCFTAAVVITIMMLAFETACDICYMHVFIAPLYLAYIPIIIIKSLNLFMEGLYWQLAKLYIIIIMFALICYCLAVLTHGNIGDGDFDLYFLCFLTCPIFAFILALSAVITFLRKNLCIPLKSNHKTENLPDILAKPVPFVPFIFIGYIIFLIGGAVI